MKARMVFWHGPYGQRIAMVTKETAKYTHLVYLDESVGIRLRKVPNVEYSKGGRMVRIALHDTDYSPRKARRTWRKSLGFTITKAAEAAMKESI